MNDGAAAYVGYLLSEKKGFSMVACGFVQADLFEKFTFANNLSFRSSAKKFLSRLSYLWITHFLLLALTVFSSVTLQSDTFRFDSGYLRCIIYGQDGEPNDRGWPTLEVEMGVAEYIFGSSLGMLRSEMAVDNSTLVIAPQLIDVCQDGSTLVGDGYILTVATSCKCIANSKPATLIKNGVDPAIAPQLKAKLDEIEEGNHGMAASFMEVGETVKIVHLLIGTNICGGRQNLSEASISLCTTSLSDHYGG
jgi:hypothetical protein